MRHPPIKERATHDNEGHTRTTIQGGYLMATTVDTLVTQFKVTGYGDVVGAFQGVGRSAAAAAASVAAVTATVSGIVALGVNAVKTAAQFQVMRSRMDTLFGSAAKGKEAFDWAVKFADLTPYDPQGVVEAVSSMKALGLSPFRDLATIGDTASALQLGVDGINRVTLALGQMKAAGKANGQDLRQLMQAGIPVNKILQTQLGLTGDQLRRIGDLGLSADTTINALLNGMDEAFGGAMANQMKGITGQVSNMEAAWQKLSATAGQVLIPTITELVEKIEGGISNPETLRRYVGFFATIVEGAKATVAPIMAWGSVMENAFKAVEDSMGILVNGFLSGVFKIMQGLQWLRVKRLEFAAFVGPPRVKAQLEAAKEGFAGLGVRADFHANAAEKARRDMVKSLSAGPSIEDLFGGASFKGIGKRIADLTSEVMAYGPGGRGLGEPAGRHGTRDLGNVSAAIAKTGSSGLQAAIESVIIGGAERARRGAAGLNSLRNLKPGSVPPITVRIQSDANDPISKALDKRIEDVSGKVLERFINDPRYRGLRN